MSTALSRVVGPVPRSAGPVAMVAAAVPRSAGGPDAEQHVEGHLCVAGLDDADRGKAVVHEGADGVDPGPVGEVDLVEQGDIGIPDLAEHQIPGRGVPGLGGKPFGVDDGDDAVQADRRPEHF